MSIVLKEVTSRNDLKKIAFLPEEIHKGHANWLPPIYSDELEFFDKHKNPSFKDCDTKLLLAYKEGKVVGRIMGIIHHNHNSLMHLKNVRFGYLECYNDPEVAHALLQDVILWGQKMGMNKIIGPYGFSDKDVQGLLVFGFDEEPVLDSACS